MKVNEIWEKFISEHEIERELVTGTIRIEFEGKDIYLHEIEGGIAKGSVYDENDNENNIYLAIYDGTVATGETLGEAISNSYWKNVTEKPLGDRLNDIVNGYPNPDEEVTIDEVMNIHKYLNPEDDEYHKYICEMLCDTFEGNTIREVLIHMYSVVFDDNMCKLIECYFGINGHECV